MAKPLSRKIDSLSSSIAFAVMELARERTARGQEVFSLSAGEPDFETPRSIVAKLEEGARKGYTKYTPVAGLREVREAVCKKLNEENQLSYSFENITLHSGTKHALFVTLQALLDEGDEVIIPAPYWVSYADMVKIAGGKCVIVPTEFTDGFLLSEEALCRAITPRTKAVMINNPLNPTGIIYPKDRLQSIGEICADRGIYILCDEIYERIVYDDSFVSMASLSEEIKEITITLGGLSKSHAMTGWRFGYSAAPEIIAQAIAKVQSHTISHPSSLTQYAALAAYDGSCEREVAQMAAQYKQRRDKMDAMLRKIPKLEYLLPNGAFYFFVNISHYLSDTIPDSVHFASALASQTGVLTIPGGAFGVEGFLRFSYAASMETIVEGMNRFGEFLLKSKNERGR